MPTPLGIPVQSSGPETLSTQLLSPPVPGPPGLGTSLGRPGSHPAERASQQTLLVVAAVVVMVAAVIAGGLRLAGVGAGPTAAEKKAAALVSLQTSIRPQLNSLMDARTRFFSAERKYLPAMKEARADLAAYSKKVKAVELETKQIDAAYAPQFANCRTYAYVSCPSPDYPDSPVAPDLSSQIKQLTAVSRSMTTLHAELIGVQPMSQLVPVYAQLLSAADSLGANAKENAVILTESVSSPQDSTAGGYVDSTKIKALNGNDALASITQMNRTLVALLKDLQLPVGSYDLPGGQDVDPDDDSLSL